MINDIALKNIINIIESESISMNVKIGKRQSLKNGNVPFSYKSFLGYRKGADGKPEIDEEQAVIIRRIFAEYLAGKSLLDIAKGLTADEIPTARGKINWSSARVQSILTNEKYKGDALLQKAYIVDCISKKSKKNNGELPMYYVEIIILPLLKELYLTECRKRSHAETVRKKLSRSALKQNLVNIQASMLYPKSYTAATAEHRIVDAHGLKTERKKLYGDASAGLITEQNTARTHRQLKNQYCTMQLQKQ